MPPRSFLECLIRQGLHQRKGTDQSCAVVHEFNVMCIPLSIGNNAVVGISFTCIPNLFPSLIVCPVTAKGLVLEQGYRFAEIQSYQIQVVESLAGPQSSNSAKCPFLNATSTRTFGILQSNRLKSSARIPDFI